ncbi:MAG: hypothetical protein PHS31_10860 [Victivallaceae bacterium]|nr:hypothetical protein [Victivallaceae bacterium]
MNMAQFRAKIYPLFVMIQKVMGVEPHLKFDYEKQEASTMIAKRLIEDSPLMICRFGSCELMALTACLNERELSLPLKIWHLVKRFEPVVLSGLLKRRMYHNAGFFHKDREAFERFTDLMIEDMRQIDVLLSWRHEELRVRKYFQNAVAVSIDITKPFHLKSPWSSVLEGKKVLVVHPFEDSIRTQYGKRKLLFKNPSVLPDFELKIVKAVQSAAGASPSFSSWFEALDYMKKEIDKHDYDIALIGAGAYGFPLAAHVKRSGKKAFHVGGALQLLFGIKGSRWENIPEYHDLFNEHWIRPSAVETPPKSNLVENSTYW